MSATETQRPRGEGREKLEEFYETVASAHYERQTFDWLDSLTENEWWKRTLAHDLEDAAGGSHEYDLEDAAGGSHEYDFLLNYHRDCPNYLIMVITQTSLTEYVSTWTTMDAEHYDECPPHNETHTYIEGNPTDWQSVAKQIVDSLRPELTTVWKQHN